MRTTVEVVLNDSHLGLIDSLIQTEGLHKYIWDNHITFFLKMDPIQLKIHLFLIALNPNYYFSN